VYATNELGAGKQTMGLVITVFIIAGVIFRPLTGKALNKFNNRKIVLLSVGLFLLCSFAYLLSSSFSSMLVLRIIHGAAFGIAATSTSAIAIRFIPQHRKGEGIGYFTLFMSLAMVCGPFLGLTISLHFSYMILFACCIIFSLLAFVFACMLEIPVLESQFSATELKGWRSYIEPKAIPISITGFVLAFSYAGLATYISIYATNLNLQNIASYFFVVFAILILVSRPFTGRVFDKHGEHHLVYPGLILFAVGMFVLSQSSQGASFLTSGGIIGLGYGALLPSLQTIAIQAAPMKHSALATGTFYVFFDSGYGVGSYLLGMIASSTSYGHMYFISAIIVVFVIALYYLLHHRKQNKELTPLERIQDVQV
jgi:predicted MFS family arabinose efflux permease